MSVRTVKKREPETEAGKVAHASTGNSVGDEADGKPSRQVGKEDSAGALKEEQKSREAEEEDPAKARKGLGLGYFCVKFLEGNANASLLWEDFRLPLLRLSNYSEVRMTRITIVII